MLTVREGARYVDNATALGWAVMEANRIELQHRLDFAVIAFDFGVSKPEPHADALELARFARGLTVTRLYILAGPCLRSQEVRRRYGEFIAELRKALPHHQVLDFSGKTDRLNELTLVGLDVAALASNDNALRDGELSRVEKDTSDGQPALLFAYLESAPKDGKLDASSLWNAGRWSALSKKRNVSGVFLNVLSGVPQTGASFPSPGKKLPVSVVSVVPHLDAAADAPGRGLLFARAGQDGHVEANPLWMSVADEPVDQQTSLLEAGLKEQNGEYDAAYGFYKEALKSKDAHVRMQADAGLKRTNTALQGLWERWKSELAAVRWSSHHWREVVIVASLLLCFVSFRLARKRVRVDMASKLGTDSPAELFMLHLIDAANIIHGVWSGMPAAITSNRGFDVNLSTEAGESIAKELEGLKIPGVDLQAVLKWLLFLWRYPSWRLELSVFGTPVQTVVYARLRFAWYTKQVWMEPTSSTGPMSVQAAAWALVYDLILNRVVMQ
jgi:hypothetical protein